MSQVPIAPDPTRFSLVTAEADRASEPGGRWFLVDAGLPAAAQGPERVERTFRASDRDRYVAKPVRRAPEGPVRIPLPVRHRLPGLPGLAALGSIAAAIGWRTIRKAGGHHG